MLGSVIEYIPKIDRLIFFITLISALMYFIQASHPMNYNSEDNIYENIRNAIIFKFLPSNFVYGVSISSIIL